jgi:hypothetical protein
LSQNNTPRRKVRRGIWRLRRHFACHFGVGEPFDALLLTLDSLLTPGSIDWALPDISVFPGEATDSDVVRVVMPEALRKDPNVHLEKEADGFVEIPNPLFAYKFQEGVDEIFKGIYEKKFKVGEKSLLEDSGLQSFAPFIIVLIRARPVGRSIENNRSLSTSRRPDSTNTHGPKEGNIS